MAQGLGRKRGPLEKLFSGGNAKQGGNVGPARAAAKRQKEAYKGDLNKALVGMTKKK